MRFTANRLLLLEAVKTVLKTVSNNKDVPEISGVLVEADADTGILSLTGTDIRTHIQKRLRQEHIEESGSIILKPVLAEMLRLLGGENVTFQTDRQLVQINSENACYTIPFLEAKAFPKLQIPFPEDTICVTGINKLIQRTMFAAENPNSDKLSMQHIKLQFENGNSQAEATNGHCVAISSSSHCANGKLEMLLHKKALNVLNSIVKPDDEIFVGIVGNFSVFMKEDLFFATMLFIGEYVEVGKLIESIRPVYKATTDAKGLYELVGNVTTILQNGDDRCVNLRITASGIFMKAETATGTSHAEIAATDTIPTPDEGFNYIPKLLLDCLQHLSGPLNISMDERGFMLIDANQSRYFVCPRGPVRIRVEKPKQEAKPKKKKVDKAEAKAA